MEFIISLLFWFVLFVCFYVYFGYPMHLWVLGKIKQEKIAKDLTETPFVTIITAAYNEENYLEETILNKSKLDYPKEKLEYILISDGSTDRTNEIIEKYENSVEFPLKIKFIKQGAREGKTAAINKAVALAEGEILLFSDANSHYRSDVLQKIVRNFADESVGYVTGKMVYQVAFADGVGEGTSNYMKYENKLRELETVVGSIVGVDGGIDAVRKKLYEPMDASHLPDFVLPLRVVKQGYRVVYEKEAILKEEAHKSSVSEYHMRVRVSLRAFWTLWEMRELFNIFQYGFFSWQLFSHKLLRYLAGLFQIILFFLNSFLFLFHWLYVVCFVIQIIFYAMALRGYFLSRNGEDIRFYYLPFYFCLINFSAFVAFIKFLNKEKMIIWEPRLGEKK